VSSVCPLTLPHAFTDVELAPRAGPAPTVNTDNRKRRNVVKRWFHRFKQARNAASRYDKAATYQPTVTIAALPQWK
jgi:transposase